MAETCFMFHLACLFMKVHLLVLLQDNCLDLVHCAFFRKLSGCMRNITAFYQHLLQADFVLVDTDISVKAKYWANISVCFFMIFVFSVLKIFMPSQRCFTRFLVKSVLKNTGLKV